jgi:hypothetical protein
MFMRIKKFVIGFLFFVSTAVIASPEKVEYIALCESPSLTSKIYSQDGWQMDNTGLFKDGMPMIEWIAAQENGDGHYKCSIYKKPAGWFWKYIEEVVQK